MSAQPEVTEPAGEDWAVVRALRLAALADAPEAFDSSLAAEEGFGEEVWRARGQGGGQRVARLDGVPVGLAAGIRHRDEHHLVAMWVSPAGRGRGVADALVRAVIGWARAQGAPRLYLWVVGSNDVAQRLYRRHGFVPTGRSQPLPSRPWQIEEQYALELA